MHKRNISSVSENDTNLTHVILTTMNAKTGKGCQYGITYGPHHETWSTSTVPVVNRIFISTSGLKIDRYKVRFI